MHTPRVTQFPWRSLLIVASSGSAVSNRLAAGSSVAYNTVHRDARTVYEPASIRAEKLSDDSSSSSSTHEAATDSPSADVSGSARLPLEGNTVNDMMCITCQHCFVSQHSPFYVLPLALPTTRVSFAHTALPCTSSLLILLTSCCGYVVFNPTSHLTKTPYCCGSHGVLGQVG